MNANLLKEDVCLWIDGVGGYAMCAADVFRFGSAAASDADASVFADIPARAFTITTLEESSVLEPLVSGISINGRKIERASILKSDDRIDVLGRVALLYRRPSPYSRSAVLTLQSRHRWNHHVDAVILMSHCCMIGNTTHAHIFNPNSDREWMITREVDTWSISQRQSAMLSQSSHRVQKQILTPMRRFKADGIQLTLAVEARTA